MKSINKIIVLTFTLMTLSGLFLYSCKTATPEPTPDNRTKTQLLIASEWKLTVSTCNVAVDTDGKNGASTDLVSQMLPCALDDTYKFNADSTTTEKAVVKCKSNEPTTYKGDWKFTNSEKILAWDDEDYTILELSDTKLTVKYAFVYSGNNYEVTDTYSH